MLFLILIRNLFSSRKKVGVHSIVQVPVSSSADAEHKYNSNKKKGVVQVGRLPFNN
jgi:hypothetical protein